MLGVQRIETMNDGYDATIFTYSLGSAANSGAAKTKPMKIACANNGAAPKR